MEVLFHNCTVVFIDENKIQKENRMYKINKIFLAMSLFLPMFAYSGEAQVKWHSFDKYSDVRPGNKLPKEQYYQDVAAHFEKHFNKLAEELPKDYILNVEVTELDLAGNVHLGTVNEFRVLKSIYFPRIDFNYFVSDKAGNIISEANDVKLKDMRFMDRIKMGRDEAYYYDKRLITDWFEDDLQPTLNLSE